MLQTLRALTSQVLAPVSGAVRAIAGFDGGRWVWASQGRTHVAVRGVHRADTAEPAKRLVAELEQLAGVDWVALNAALGRVVVEHDPDVISVSELVDAVAEAEESTALSEHPIAESSGLHPGNPAKIVGDAVVMGANLAGLGYSLAANLLAVPALPPSVPAVLTTADSVPRIRERIEARLGRSAANVVMGLGGAAANTFAQRSITLVSDSVYRFCLLRESQSAQNSWARWEDEFGADPEQHHSEPIVLPQRPEALPSGAVEEVAHSSALATPAMFAGVLGVTQSFQRAQAMLVAGAPRAAHVGREAFAAQLGYGLSERDTLVLDQRVVRRLDRVNAVVIDGSLLHTGARIVEDVLPIAAGVDTDEVWERAQELVGTDIHQPGWSLGPVPLPSGLPHRIREVVHQLPAGRRAHALNRDDTLVAVVVVEDELDPLADELLAAARETGLVVLAGRGGDLHRRLDIDRVVSAGTHLPSAVRELQGEGYGVVVLSATNRAALASADVGIGVSRDTAPPWGAHLVSGPGLGECCALLRIVPKAREVSRRSAQLAIAGSVGGAFVSLIGTPLGSQGRATVPVTVSALLAFGAGTWWGMQAARKPVPRAAPRTPWHAMSPPAVLEMLSSTAGGLSDKEAKRRLALQEALPEHTAIGLFRASLEELASPLTPALAGGAGISATIGAVADAVMIVGVLGLNAVIGGVQRINADVALRKLLEASAVPVTVRRDRNQVRVPAEELVQGDVVELLAGDAVPADCRLLEASGLEVDESSLTGESQLVDKAVAATPAAAVADRHCMLYQGTAVAAGEAVALVVATGSATEAGSAAPADNETGRQDGVAARLRELAKITVPLCIGSGGLLLVADLLRLQPFGVALGRAVSLAVAAVPEGLPFVATVAELAAAGRLSKRGALVHNSATIEALGRAQVLCFDKTGTLTEGQIALRRVSDGKTSHGTDELSTVEKSVLGAALRASPVAENGEILPHPTDRAVVNGAHEVGVLSDAGLPGWIRVDELPFEPSRGYHAVLGREHGRHLLSVKGAPEIVLAQCKYWRRPEGDVPLDAAALEELDREIDILARQGFRVLAVGERPASDRRDLDESRIRHLRLVGFVALADPVRATAAAAVEQLQLAQVGVVMVTGDHPSTAEAIAAELNVLNGHRVMTGIELEALSDEQLAAEVGDIAVFARVTPTQKARIVRALQRNDKVVAVTGDGANDAPAIRLADIGIALGEHATPAAREAADVIVTDNRIETIVDAIVEGRAMWASVRDSLALLLGGNLGEIGFTVITGLISPGQSINARQLLLVNLLTDVLPAMAIAVRPPPRVTAEMLLAEGPEKSLGTALTRDIYRRGVITAGAATVAWFLGRLSGTRSQAATVALVALVGAQLGQTMVIRGRTPLVLLSGAVSIAALVAAVQIPGVSRFFGSSPLLPHGWVIAIGTSAAATALSYVVQ